MGNRALQPGCAPIAYLVLGAISEGDFLERLWIGLVPRVVEKVDIGGTLDSVKVEGDPLLIVFHFHPNIFEVNLRGICFSNVDCFQQSQAVNIRCK